MHARLGAAAEALGLALSDAQSSQLIRYLDLLAKWNKVYNLTGVRDPEQMLTQHLADSLAVVAPLRRHVAERPLSLTDVGSGGGLPGIVVAVMMPMLRVTCVDAVAKKASFIRQAAAELRLQNLAAVHARIEAWNASQADIVVSRAFASLAGFVRLTSPHLAHGGVWMAMKGRQPIDEIAALPPSVEVFHVEQLAVPGLDAERCLVWMRLASSRDSPDLGYAPRLG